MGKKKGPAKPSNTDVYNRATTAFNQSQTPSPLETQMGQNYAQGSAQNMQDYGNIMGGFRDFNANLGGPTKFSYKNVSAQRPAELGESYGYLREAMPGYREFAATGGYSPTDIQEMRARGVSPIRAVYGNTQMELNRARSLGGGAANYIAAASRAQRELPEQIASATTDVNARLADSIRQGRMFGLGGITQTGSTMGGLSSAEAGRMLQADLANQGADLQAQGMGEQSLQDLRRNQLAGLSGQAGLYGTTPGMAATFGNQALGAEQGRQQYGLGLLEAQMRATGQEQQKRPWWQTALNVAGTAAPYVAMAMSSRTVKKDIKEVKGTSKFAKHLKDLPLYTWKYKGDDTTHFGPIAEEFKEKLGIGDGKTLHLVDVMGVMLASAKENLAHG